LEKLRVPLSNGGDKPTRGNKGGGSLKEGVKGKKKSRKDPSKSERAESQNPRDGRYSKKKRRGQKGIGSQDSHGKGGGEWEIRKGNGERSWNRSGWKTGKKEHGPEDS